MKFTIDQVIEQVTYPAPGRRVLQVEIHYTTEGGYKGTIVLDKSAATPDAVKAAIKADADRFDKMIGTTLSS